MSFIKLCPQDYVVSKMCTFRFYYFQRYIVFCSMNRIYSTISAPKLWNSSTRFKKVVLPVPIQIQTQNASICPGNHICNTSSSFLSLFLLCFTCFICTVALRVLKGTFHIKCIAVIINKQPLRQLKVRAEDSVFTCHSKTKNIIWTIWMPDLT